MQNNISSMTHSASTFGIKQNMLLYNMNINVLQIASADRKLTGVKTKYIDCSQSF